MTTTQMNEVERFLQDLRSVREYWQRGGMSGAEIARRFGGMHRNRVNQWIQGVTRPDVLVVKALRPILDDIIAEQQAAK